MKTCEFCLFSKVHPRGGLECRFNTPRLDAPMFPIMQSDDYCSKWTAHPPSEVLDSGIRVYHSEESLNRTEAFRPGTQVKIKHTSFEGHVTYVRLYLTYVLYGVTYLENGARVTSELAEDEFETEAYKQKVGFK